MSIFPRTTKRSLIGVDWGDGGVRAAQLLCGGGCFAVAALERNDRRAPGASVSERSPTKDPVLPNGLGDCAARAGFRGHEIVLGLNTPDAEYLTLDMPPALLRATSEEIHGAVKFEVERLSAAAASGFAVETAYWFLPATSVAAPNVIGVAARAKAVAELLQLAAEGGLTCRAVDGAAVSLCRFGVLLDKRPDDHMWGILDLGRRQTRLIISLGEVPVLVRPVGNGGQSWTERIAASLHVSEKAAEVLKKEHGIDAGRLGTVLTGILRAELTELAAEVKRSYEYVLSCYPSRQVSDLLLVGGGAAMPGLDEFLRGLLGIPVRRVGTCLSQPSCRLRSATGDPFEGSTWESFALAIGLAIGD